MNSVFCSLTNRDIALFIWTVILILALLMKKSIRTSISAVFETLTNKTAFVFILYGLNFLVWGFLLI